MQENPYGINSCSRSPAELQGSHARVRPHWGLVRWVTVWGEAFWVNFHTVQLSRPAKQSPWWQLMRPALRATCQLRPSASWHRGTARAGCLCMSTPRNFHNVPTVCRNALRQFLGEFAHLKISADDAAETTVFWNCAVPPDLWPPCETRDQCSLSKISHHTALSKLCSGGT